MTSNIQTITNKTVACFTHNDLDGAACGVIATAYAKASNRSLYSRYCGYGTIDKEIDTFLVSIEIALEEGSCKPEDIVVLVADITPSEETMTRLDKLVAQGFQVVHADHHKSALKYNSIYDWSTVKENEQVCGASILRILLCEQCPYLGTLGHYSCTHFIADVATYDNWLFDKEHRNNPKDLNDLCSIMDKDDFVNMVYKELSENPLESFEIRKNIYLNNIVESSQGKQAEYCAQRCLNHCDRMIHHKLWRIIIAERNQSMIADMALSDIRSAKEENPDWIRPDLVAVFSLPNRVSLRTDLDTVDVSAAAKEFGGGGHPKAAGFELKDFDTEAFTSLLLESCSIR